VFVISYSKVISYFKVIFSSSLFGLRIYDNINGNVMDIFYILIDIPYYFLFTFIFIELKFYVIIYGM